MLKHHPSPELLADYTAGCMPLSHSLCIATHLALCPECRRYVNRLNSLGGCLFNQQSSSDTCLAELKNRVMASIDDNNTHDNAPLSVKPPTDKPDVPRPLHQFFQGKQCYADLSWINLSPSIKVATLLRDKDGAQIALTRVKPGGKMPHHSHTGDEFTVVLKGAFSDENGVYRQGDFIHRDAKDRHKPVVTSDAECICLMVLDAPIQFTGWFTRVLNPLLRKSHGLAMRQH